MGVPRDGGQGHAGEARLSRMRGDAGADRRPSRQAIRCEGVGTRSDCSLGGDLITLVRPLRKRSRDRGRCGTSRRARSARMANLWIATLTTVKRSARPGGLRHQTFETLESLPRQLAMQLSNPARLRNKGLVTLPREFGLNFKCAGERAGARELFKKTTGLLERLSGVIAIGLRDGLEVDRRGFGQRDRRERRGRGQRGIACRSFGRGDGDVALLTDRRADLFTDGCDDLFTDAGADFVTDGGADRCADLLRRDLLLLRRRLLWLTFFPAPRLGLLACLLRFRLALTGFPDRLVLVVVCTQHSQVAPWFRFESQCANLCHVCALIAVAACCSRGGDVLRFGRKSERLRDLQN